MMLLAALLLSLWPLGASAAGPCAGVMDGVEQGRWTVVRECTSYEATVVGYATSSGGAYWLLLDAQNGPGWAKVYPGRGIQRPEAWERVIVTGTHVTEQNDGNGWLTAKRLWQELIVSRLERPDVARQYNEQRADGSWWQVTLMRFGVWHEHLIEPSDYRAAGIVR